MNRRNFLKITFAAGVASALPALAAEPDIPRIVGDFKHDDTAGLQAALNGEPFICEAGLVRVVGGNVYISGGYFLVTKTLRIGKVGTYITHSNFEMAHDGPGLSVSLDARGEIRDSVIRSSISYWDSGSIRGEGIRETYMKVHPPGA